MIDLCHELALAICAARRGPEKEWLAKHGVDCPLLGVDQIRQCGRGYDRDRGGFSAFILPVLDRAVVQFADDDGVIMPCDLGGKPPALLDIAAWRPSMPRDVLLRRGAVDALGEWALEPAMAEDEPLHLWSTPLAWARAQFEGAVVIDWKAAAPRLLYWHEIVCDTADLAARLDNEIRKVRRRLLPPMPKIEIPVEAAL